jgi:hypothetical protein
MPGRTCRTSEASSPYDRTLHGIVIDMARVRDDRRCRADRPDHDEGVLIATRRRFMRCNCANLRQIAIDTTSA